MSWIAYDVRTATGGVLARVHSLDEAELVAARYNSAAGVPVEIVLVDL